MRQWFLLLIDEQGLIGVMRRARPGGVGNSLRLGSASNLESLSTLGVSEVIQSEWFGFDWKPWGLLWDNACRLILVSPEQINEPVGFKLSPMLNVLIVCLAKLVGHPNGWPAKYPTGRIDSKCRMCSRWNCANFAAWDCECTAPNHFPPAESHANTRLIEQI
jgi:hypothetical protein